MKRRDETPKGGTLDRIGAKLDELPAARRKAIEMELAKLERRAGYDGAKRGPKPKFGETMTAVCVVKCSPAVKAEFLAEAEALGFDNVADYFRELHRRHVAAGRRGAR